MQPIVDTLLTVTPFQLALFVGNVETYFAHTIDVRKFSSPVVTLFYWTIPIVI